MRDRMKKNMEHELEARVKEALYGDIWKFPLIGDPNIDPKV